MSPGARGETVQGHLGRLASPHAAPPGTAPTYLGGKPTMKLWNVIVTGVDQDGDEAGCRFTVEAEDDTTARSEAAWAAKDCGWEGIETSTPVLV